MTPDNSIRNSEILFTEDNLKKLACYGLEYAKKKIAQNGAVAPTVASHDKVFEKYLAYIVFGRIINLSTVALKDGMPHADSVRLFEELGLSINQKLAKSGTPEMKAINFSDTKMVDVMRQSFDTIEVDDLFTQLTGPDIKAIRKLGSVVVPENPKTEQKISTYTLE